MTKKDIDAYRIAIENLAATSSDYVFANSGAEHACIVMSNIFKTAQTNVYMFAKNLKGDVSKGEYLIQLEEYLKNRGYLQVLLEENSDENSSEAIKIMKKYPNKISISVIDKTVLQKRQEIGNINHFTIADDKMFRYETDVVNYTAVCSFNDRKTYSQLNGLYKFLSSKSKIISNTPN